MSADDACVTLTGRKWGSAMNIGVLREQVPGERRVALTPDRAAALGKAGLSVLLQAGAGDSAGFPDDQYESRGVTILDDRAQVIERADVLLSIWTYPARPDDLGDDLQRLRSDQIIIGMADPLSAGRAMEEFAGREVTAFAMELMPRTTRAQSMDVLSSQATVAGYKAVLLAASELPKMLPMLMTAAGTVRPAHVLVIGAGVAGLQAIATARRLGAVVAGYDIRPAVKEQVRSLGATFVEVELDTGETEDTGGYAKAMDETFYQRQQELLAKTVAEQDAVITTALIPGKPSPVLVTESMVKAMRPGSVIVDLAAERGGNCELTQPDETITEHGVTIMGPTNLPATVPFHASQMYAANITSFLLHLVKDGELTINTDDEITRETLVTRGGEIIHPRLVETASS